MWLSVDSDSVCFILNIFVYFNLCLCGYVCMKVCHGVVCLWSRIGHLSRCLWSAEQGIGFTEAGVSGSLSKIDSGNWTWVLSKNIKYSYLLRPLCRLQDSVFCQNNFMFFALFWFLSCLWLLKKKTKTQLNSLAPMALFNKRLKFLMFSLIL